MDIDQLILLAGGEATRLRPLTDRIAKAVVPFRGRPFLWYLLNWFRGSPITRSVLLVGHGAESVRRHIPLLNEFEIELAVIPDGDELKGTGGALRSSIGLLDERFLVMNADTLPLFDWSSWFIEVPDKGSALTVCPTSSKDGNAELGRETIVAYEKPSIPGSAYMDAGLTVLEREWVALLPDHGRSSLEHDLLPEMARQGHLGAVRMDEGIIDMGTPEGHAQLLGHLTRSSRCRDTGGPL